ncbi:MAG: tetratricopeptide repeat protein [Pseudomonadaceae bacterium]
MHRMLKLVALSGLFMLPAAPLLAESDNPLLISANDRCAFERVDDESLPLALEVCQQAAETGDMQAQFELGQLYYKGERVEQDFATSLQWLEKASIQGEPKAQYLLGMMHFNGEGIPRNLPQAYIILKMAAVNGNDDAIDAADMVGQEMNTQELQVANHVLGTLFRDYLAQIREEQLNGSLESQEPGDPQLDSSQSDEDLEQQIAP